MKKGTPKPKANAEAKHTMDRSKSKVMDKSLEKSKTERTMQKVGKGDNTTKTQALNKNKSVNKLPSKSIAPKQQPKDATPKKPLTKQTSKLSQTNIKKQVSKLPTNKNASKASTKPVKKTPKKTVVQLKPESVERKVEGIEVDEIEMNAP